MSETHRIECKKCGCGHIYVLWTRPTIRGIMRRRECRNCGFRFTTRETIQAEKDPEQ